MHGCAAHLCLCGSSVMWCCLRIVHRLIMTHAPPHAPPCADRLKGNAASSIVKHNVRDPLVLVVPECVAAARLICQTASPRSPALHFGQQAQEALAASEEQQQQQEGAGSMGQQQQQQHKRQQEGLRDGTRIAIIDAGELLKTTAA